MTFKAFDLSNVVRRAGLGVSETKCHGFGEPCSLGHAVIFSGRDQNAGRPAVLRDHNRLASLGGVAKPSRRLPLELANRDNIFGDFDGSHAYIMDASMTEFNP
jgi:hypothetical protein